MRNDHDSLLTPEQTRAYEAREAEERDAYWAEQRRDHTSHWLVAEVVPTLLVTVFVLVVVGSLVAALVSVFWPAGVIAGALAWEFVGRRFVVPMWAEILRRPQNPA